jgi:hypothetical protein
LGEPDLRDGHPLITIGSFIADDSITTQPLKLHVDKLDRECNPVVTSNGKTDERVEAGALRLTVQVPKGLLSAEQNVRVRIPFHGNAFDSEGFIHPGLRVDRVVRWTEGDKAILDLIGAGFDDQVEVLAGAKNYSAPLQRIGTTVLRLQASKAELGSVTELLVHRGLEEPIVVSTVVPPEKKAAKFTSKSVRVLAQSVQGVSFAGENLGSIASVFFDGSKLPSQVSADGKKLTVYLGTKVTQHAGVPVELIAETASGNIIDSLIVNVTAKEKSSATKTDSKAP